MHPLRQFRTFAIGAAFAPLAASAPAQTYPSKSLRFIVPALAGTSPDLLARTIAHHLGPRLGQQIVIMNQSGGGGNIGHGTAAKATPDGYTLLVTSDRGLIRTGLRSRLRPGASCVRSGNSSRSSKVRRTP